MPHELKILHLEDVASDAEMIERELKKSNILFEKRLVDNKAGFVQGLIDFCPDVILSDHSLPSFDSLEALKIVRNMGISIPFILITSTVSEEYAVKIMREGAWDYILKDRLQRLPNALLNAIDKYNLEAERRRAEEVLRSSERKYKLLFESNPMPMWMISKSNHAIIDVNEAAIKHYGYSKEEFLTMNVTHLQPEDDIKKYLSHAEKKITGLYKSGTWRHKRKDGSVIFVDLIAHDIIYEDKVSKLILANDITEKLKAEADLIRQRILQQKLVTETTIQAQEKEREEIGKELHDNINQILTATKLYLEIAMASDEHHRPELLHKSYENISNVIQEIRYLSHQLVAPSLGDISLDQAILELISNIRQVSSKQIAFTTQNYNEAVIGKDIKLMLYRIVQEQLNNVLKHSNATNISIELNITAGQIVLVVKDDGIGFDTSKTSTGIGLRNINNRASFYNGVTRIISTPGKGCTLEVTLPLIVKE